MVFPTLLRITCLLGLFVLFAGGGLQAQDLIYRPVNPAFGGNALNYGWMINSANAQNGLTDPGQGGGPSSRRDDQLENFTAGLERQLLSQLSREIFNRQFGENLLEDEGTFQLGNFQVDVQPGVDGLFITITDFSTGGTTNLTVPFF
jgi:curli production assembly/transport component CsgF